MYFLKLQGNVDYTCIQQIFNENEMLKMLENHVGDARDAKHGTSCPQLAQTDSNRKHKLNNYKMKIIIKKKTSKVCIISCCSSLNLDLLQTNS